MRHPIVAILSAAVAFCAAASATAQHYWVDQRQLPQLQLATRLQLDGAKCSVPVRFSTGPKQELPLSGSDATNSILHMCLNVSCCCSISTMARNIRRPEGPSPSYFPEFDDGEYLN
jgi:hypothetical protein